MSFETGWVPERPGSSIMVRRYYDSETGVGGYEERIPIGPPMSAEQIRACLDYAATHDIIKVT